jgi:RNase adaptor protein for sRNA GlmZ degradation
MQTHLYSFSYAHTGLPPDPWGHGGGFVFDCRLLPNPGRDTALAPFTGADDCVRAYLAAQPAASAFLTSVAAIVDAAVAEYRGYEHLTVAFGCTGGRHRSVYCAEWMRARRKNSAAR